MKNLLKAAAIAVIGLLTMGQTVLNGVVVTNDVGIVPSNAFLQQVPTNMASRAIRFGHDSPGDGPAVNYYASASACSLNSGAGDGGWQVKSADGKCWIASFSGQFDVRVWGAKGQCSAASCAINDSPAIQQAFAACYALGGGQIWFPPTGAMYRIATGISTGGNGCNPQGSAEPNWPGSTGTQAQWGAQGSWISCEDTSNSCFGFGGSAAVDGLNFWEQQPTPSTTSGTAWTPLDIPYVIKFTQQFSRATHIQLANVSRGIAFNYASNANIAGSYSSFEHIWRTGFRTTMLFTSVNDTMHCSDIHERHLWQIGNSNVIDWMEANAIGWDIEYLDNMQCTDVEFYKQLTSIKFTDASATYGTGTITHAAENLQLTNVLFNQVVQAVNLAAGTTNVSAYFTNTLAQTDTDTGRAASYLFNFASDNVDVAFTGLQVGATGNGILALGAGTSGRARISGLNVQSPYPTGTVNGYGYLGNGSAAFTLAKGSTLDITGGVQNVVKGSTGAGAIIACASPGSNAAGSNCGKVLAVTTAVTPTSP